MDPLINFYQGKKKKNKGQQFVFKVTCFWWIWRGFLDYFSLWEGLRVLQAHCLINKKTFHSIYFSVTCCLLLANFLVGKHNKPCVCTPL